jgi:type I restriction enzyme S subunit
MITLDSTSSIGTATNSGVIRNIKFLVPSEFVLVKFQKTIEPIFKNLQLLQEQSATLAELRESLLARLVSGELQIPEEMLAS